MTLQKLTPNDDFELFSIETNPSRTYISSSTEGVTGSVYLYSRRSDTEKDIQQFAQFRSSIFSDTNMDTIRNLALLATGSNIYNQVDNYMSLVGSHPESLRKQQKLEIHRFNPPFSFNSNFVRKSLVRDHLMPYHRVTNPRAHYNTTNYNCLNFFTASNVPSDSVLLYPNEVADDGIGSTYQVSGAFTFDFFVRPKYKGHTPTAAYRPGVVMHLSNSYCLSIHSGSSKDIFGYPDRFKFALQLGEDASTGPNTLNTASPLTIVSTDNALSRDAWNHVTITWGGPTHTAGSGSCYVNGTLDSNFCISTPVFVGHFTGSADPTVLCVGNYYEGDNDLLSSQDRFFAADTAEREGLVELNGTAGVFSPVSYSFAYPLNAEIHDLKLYSRYLPHGEVQDLGSSGPSSLDGLQFYLPPFFTEESPYRTSVAGTGGEMVTPFFAKNATTTTPFAAQMAFSCGGFYMNLENYTRELVTGNYPRLWNLSGSVFTPPPTTILSANDFLFATGSCIKRTYTVLPCDNGDFQPDFSVISNLSQSRFVNDLGNSDPGVVSLNDIVDDFFVSRAIQASGSSAILDDVLGAQPDNLVALPGNSLAILHRTRDASSNQVVILDVSNMFYGQRIKRGSLTIRDSQLRYVDFGTTIKDDGLGNLYRADAVQTNHATWATVGNVFYDEGIIILKTPQLYFFGENQFEVSFKGEQDIHVMSIRAVAKAMTSTDSSNTSYYLTKEDGYNQDPLANEPDEENFVYITGINIHDENLNVVARTALAQPIQKRSGDKITFVIKLDY